MAAVAVGRVSLSAGATVGGLGRLAPRLEVDKDLELVRLFCWVVGPTSGGTSLWPAALPLEAAAVASGTSPGCWPAS